MNERTSRFLMWAGGIAVAFAGTYITAVLTNLLPTPSVVVCKMRELWAKATTGKQTANPKISILLSPLDNDDKGIQTRRVQDALNGWRGLRVRQLCRRLTIGPNADQTAIEEKGREFLRRDDADLLIWGFWDDTGKELSLRFLPRTGEGTTPMSFPELKTGFSDALGAQLAAVAMTSAALVTDRLGEYLVGVLTPVAAKLQAAIKTMPAATKDDTRAALHHSFGLAAATIGEQSGDDQWLQQAVTAFREALKEWPRERVPLAWAAVQNNLGNALRTLGTRESGTARLDEAATAYREALKEYTRERVPLAWAATQNNLGAALGILGERESGTARLDEAVTAFREALKEYTRERVPLDWAVTQNNLGTALRTLGERESGTARLDEAATAYRNALEVFRAGNASHYVEGTEHNLHRVTDLIASRRQGG
ncbi:MAG: tetratricopeptide repeat protein [Alphaproteobacteria bacterium]|nr:tetratricopeptide repeat protein [Alphaproteobacteria bacterium]